MGDVHGYPVASYSGGWRTKTQLAAAKPLSADVLMFNETTGHSDVRHEWLEDWRRLSNLSWTGCARTLSTSRTAKRTPSRAKRPVADTISGEASREKAYCGAARVHDVYFPDPGH